MWGAIGVGVKRLVFLGSDEVLFLGYGGVVCFHVIEGLHEAENEWELMHPSIPPLFSSREGLVCTGADV